MKRRTSAVLAAQALRVYRQGNFKAGQVIWRNAIDLALIERAKASTPILTKA